LDGRAEPIARVVELADELVALVAEALDARGMRLDEQGVEVLVVVEHRAPAEPGLLRDIRERERPQPVHAPRGIRRLDERGTTRFLPLRSCHVLTLPDRSCQTPRHSSTLMSKNSSGTSDPRPRKTSHGTQPT